jgi:hypothetical protein
MLTLHVLVMEDDDTIARNLCDFFRFFSEGQRLQMREDFIPEFLEVEFSVKVTVVSAPCAAQVLIQETGEGFDIVVSDGTGWLDAAVAAARRFPVIGYTGSRECLRAFKGVGIECYLKGCSNGGESRTILGLTALALKVALTRAGATSSIRP